jgi:putative oxidoreductase
MSSEHQVDVALLVFRLAVGTVCLAHGYNHLLGGGKLAGTARWFGSLGMRPPMVHALVATFTELGIGVLFVLGLLTPLAGAGLIGVMVVAWITNHRKNGFFIFRPGEGYEYVMVLTASGVLFAGVGGGQWSVDRALKIFTPPSWLAFVVCLALGFGGAVLTLVTSWRPARPVETQPATS